MPRKAGDHFKPWRAGGVPLGHIRSGIYWIDRTIHGRRYRLSTGCRTAAAALGEYQRFEADPPRYVPRGKVGTGWDQAAQGYLAFSAGVKLNSPRHVEHQEMHLANLGAFTRGGSRVFASLDGFTGSDVRTFIAALTAGEITGNKVGAPTVNRHLATLRGFLRWAREERLTVNRADREVPMLREDQGVRLPTEVPEAQWRAVLPELPERWRSACLVMLGVGLRYSEVAHLVAEDVLEHGIHVPRAKGRRARTVPASPATVAAARRLLALGGVPDDEASQLEHRIECAARRAGQARFRGHELRHTYATVCLRNGVSLRDLQERLGHASIRTTEKYLHALHAKDGRRTGTGAPF